MRVEDYITVEVNGVTIMARAEAVNVDDEADAADAINKLCRHIEAIESEQLYVNDCTQSLHRSAVAQHEADESE